MRRRLWSETIIDDEPLEYTGRGSELFIGYLIGTCIVSLPLAVGLPTVQAVVSSGPAVIALVGVLYFGLLVIISTGQFLARRNQLSRTLWRGVHFYQSGSAFGYGLAASGNFCLTVLT